MTHRLRLSRTPAALAAALVAALLPSGAQASSHREAPFITTAPKVDGTDLYLFASYESGRAGYVTLLANYQPLQDAYGGPNYFQMDANALYEIHIDNDGDAREDLTFAFRFRNLLANGGRGTELPIGSEMVPIPLVQSGQVTQPGDSNLNVQQRYGVSLRRGEQRDGDAQPLRGWNSNQVWFMKPLDNVGTKTLPDYAGYAARHVYGVRVPGCDKPARLFAGQRREAFAVNLGPVFDLVNAPLGLITDPAQINAVPNPLDDKNVTTLALEIHKDCLTAGGDPVIGAWTSASLPESRRLVSAPPPGLQTSERVEGKWVQVSRLGMPLVNEVVIGLRDKDRFNASRPRDDAQFGRYVTNPTLPALLEIALGAPGIAPKNLPRTDLATTFLTGIAGLNRPRQVVPAEMLRLNTAIAPVPFAQQNRLGVVGNLLAGGQDNAGYPNGRRPKDDVVDISLVAVMGGLCVANGNGDRLQLGAACRPAAVPLGDTALKLHDAVDQARVPLLAGFPYLAHPVPGAR
jgi:hypothetical protein